MLLLGVLLYQKSIEDLIVIIEIMELNDHQELYIKKKNGIMEFHDTLSKYTK